MSVFRQAPPGWCELKSFAIIDLKDGDRLPQRRAQPKERLLATFGTTQLFHADGSLLLKENQFFELAPDLQEWTLRGCSTKAQIVRLSGTWGEDMGGCGIFRVENQADPTNTGDPVDYPKTTRVDSHYHDCDEYWVLLEGAASVMVGGQHMKMTAGDCVSIGMGHHHDMPTVQAPVKAVFFETTLEGQKRVGHLWNHTHGIAVPKPERT